MIERRKREGTPADRSFLLKTPAQWGLGHYLIVTLIVVLLGVAGYTVEVPFMSKAKSDSSIYITRVSKVDWQKVMRFVDESHVFIETLQKLDGKLTKVAIDYDKKKYSFKEMDNFQDEFKRSRVLARLSECEYKIELGR